MDRQATTPVDLYDRCSFPTWDLAELDGTLDIKECNNKTEALCQRCDSPYCKEHMHWIKPICWHCYIEECNI